MGRAKSSRIRWQVIGMMRSGMTKKAIARRLGLHRNTVTRLWETFQNTNDVQPGKSTGRPRKSTRRSDNYLYLLCRQNHHGSAKSLCQRCQEEAKVTVCRKTVNN